MDRDYRDIIEKVGEQNFKNRFMELNRAINEFLSEAKYPDWAKCNERILYHVLLDYYADINRLKEFHGITNAKTDKVMAYLVYWILRRKPIQLTECSEEERDIFVNERFACNMLIGECLLEKDDSILKVEIQERFEKYLDLVLYYFKYRQYNPQVIELMIESFKMGREF